MQKRDLGWGEHERLRMSTDLHGDWSCDCVTGWIGCVLMRTFLEVCDVEEGEGALSAKSTSTSSFFCNSAHLLGPLDVRCNAGSPTVARGTHLLDESIWMNRVLRCCRDRCVRVRACVRGWYAPPFKWCHCVVTRPQRAA